MRKIIYRGYKAEEIDINNWHISKDGKVVSKAISEDAAYLWIDGEKAVEHKK